MSTWHEIDTVENVEVSDDENFIDIIYSSDDNGNNYITVPIYFIIQRLREKSII